MTRETFEQRLDLLSPRSESKIAALVEEYRKDLSGLQSAAPSSVIVHLEETAVEALASKIAGQKLVPETSLAIAMVHGVLVAESMVAGRLKAALQDSRLVPQPPGLMEEVGPPYRVCDAAYIALRLVLNPESYLQHLMEKHHFLSLSDADKNQEIESWLRTSSFTRFLDDMDAEED
ncbi:MAG TPA: hypothetical protein VMH28_11580 [Candidatus Acidoferrales bacterium]|nr:hypothetical protein [Candidatus Acidoferrales bacterium]